MSNKFKKQAGQLRTGIPQIDLESVKPPIVSPPTATEAITVEPELESAQQPEPQYESEQQPEPKEPAATEKPKLTIVDTSESKVNRGFFMYPGRHRQVTRDLAYIEERKPHEIIEDALEEYVVKHYGKEYKRK